NARTKPSSSTDNDGRPSLGANGVPVRPRTRSTGISGPTQRQGSVTFMTSAGMFKPRPSTVNPERSRASTGRVNKKSRRETRATDIFRSAPISASYMPKISDNTNMHRTKQSRKRAVLATSRGIGCPIKACVTRRSRPSRSPKVLTSAQATMPLMSMGDQEIRKRTAESSRTAVRRPEFTTMGSATSSTPSPVQQASPHFRNTATSVPLVSEHPFCPGGKQKRIHGGGMSYCHVFNTFPHKKPRTHKACSTLRALLLAMSVDDIEKYDRHGNSPILDGQRPRGPDVVGVRAPGAVASLATSG